MHHCVGLVFAEYARHFRGIADIDLLKAVARIVRDRSQRLQVARVSQFVDIDHAAIGIVDELTDDCRTDESGSAGDEYLFHKIYFTLSEMNLLLHAG